MLDYLLKLEGEENKLGRKVIEYSLQIHVHNFSGFDTRITLCNLTCHWRKVDVNKNRKCIISLKVFNVYIQCNRKRKNQYLFFRCGMIHLKCSFKS